MDTNDLIALYLSEKLSPEDQKEFDHLMATNDDFKKEVLFQSNLKTVISKEEQDTIKAKLQSYEEEISSKPFNFRGWMVAASVIALLGFSLFWFNNDPVDNNILFDKYYEPYRNVVQPIVRGENTTDVKSKAFEAYENKDFETALSYFNLAIEQNNEAALKFYKGITQLQLGNISEAIGIFENLQELPDNLETQRNWYLALAYLKNGNVEDVKTILQKLNLKNNAFKNEEVDSLLNALD